MIASVDWTSITAILAWIAMGGGGAYLASVLASYLVENASWWHTLPGQVKFVLPMIFAVLMSVLASILLQYSEWISIAQPWWIIIVNSAIAYIGSQKAYVEQRKAGYGRKAWSKNIEQLQ